MSYTRNDGSAEEPVATRMVEIRPHVFVSEDFARANGLSRYVPKREPKAKAEKPGRATSLPLTN